MNRKFTPYIKTYKTIEGVFDRQQFKDEPMFFSSSLRFVLENTHHNSITRNILLELNDYIDKDAVIDTRVTMLMQGYYPAIPGWHCDDFPRHKSGQPDLASPDASEHIMVLLADTHDLSCTEFITDTAEFDLDPNNVWADLHRQVQGREYLHKKKIKEGEVVFFNQEAIHRASPATKPGWRMFFRASKCHRIPVNEIRKQVQVYLTNDNGGW